MSHATLRSAALIGAGDCTVIQIKKLAMIEILHTEPKVADLFITFLVHRSRLYEGVLSDHLFDNSERRLVRTLLQLSSLGAVTDELVTLPK